MSSAHHQIETSSIVNLTFGERLALEMIGAVLWPLGADERIGVLLTILTDNVSDVVANAAEVDALVERLRLHFMLECLDRNPSH